MRWFLWPCDPESCTARNSCSKVRVSKWLLLCVCRLNVKSGREMGCILKPSWDRLSDPHTWGNFNVFYFKIDVSKVLLIFRARAENTHGPLRIWRHCFHHQSPPSQQTHMEKVKTRKWTSGMLVHLNLVAIFWSQNLRPKISHLSETLIDVIGVLHINLNMHTFCKCDCVSITVLLQNRSNILKFLSNLAREEKSDVTLHYAT